MFNAAFVSSPDGGRNCFESSKKPAQKKNGSPGGGPPLDFQSSKILGD